LPIASLEAFGEFNWEGMSTGTASPCGAGGGVPIVFAIFSRVECGVFSTPKTPHVQCKLKMKARKKEFGVAKLPQLLELNRPL
jgi:hypothetical protein